jgi:tRNA U34 5-carboxymethylaminomethyl modifying GTPase MnmE/TrmE
MGVIKIKESKNYVLIDVKRIIVLYLILSFKMISSNSLTIADMLSISTQKKLASWEAEEERKQQIKEEKENQEEIAQWERDWKEHQKMRADKLATWSEYLSSKQLRAIAFAAKTGEQLTQVQNALVAYAKSFAGDANELIVTNERHHEALLNALTALRDIKAGLAQDLTGDLLSLDIRRCLYAIGSITGSIQHDKDILGAIFGKFCIGK